MSDKSKAMDLGGEWIMSDTSEKFDESTMREMAAPKPKTLQELVDVIEGMGNMEDHDYGTTVYAVSVAATAAFNYMAAHMGMSGFQASIADMDVIRRTRHMRGPFILLDGNELLFPQYDTLKEVREWMESCKPWLKEEATRLLSEDGAVDRVREHWRKLAAWEPQAGGDE